VAFLFFMILTTIDTTNKTSNRYSKLIKIPERTIIGWFLLDCWRANQLFL